jgi:hypothetical protein
VGSGIIGNSTKRLHVLWFPHGAQLYRPKVVVSAAPWRAPPVVLLEVVSVFNWGSEKMYDRKQTVVLVDELRGPVQIFNANSIFRSVQ